MKGLDGQIDHEDAVFASGKEDHRIFKLSRDFTKDEDGFGFEFFEMIEVVFQGIRRLEGYSSYKAYRLIRVNC